MTNTKKNPFKEERSWNELLKEKKAYLLRKQEEEDAAAVKKIYDHYNGRWDEDDSTD